MCASLQKCTVQMLKVQNWHVPVHRYYLALHATADYARTSAIQERVMTPQTTIFPGTLLMNSNDSEILDDEFFLTLRNTMTFSNSYGWGVLLADVY